LNHSNALIRTNTHIIGIMTRSYRLTIWEVERLSEFPTRSWKIEVRNVASAQASVPFTLVDPLSEDGYEDLRWYIEDYALQDPFAKGRANRAIQNLDRFAQAMIFSLQPYVNELVTEEDKDAEVQLLHFVVVGDGTRGSLHSLPWELLERDTCLIGISKCFAQIAVSRLSRISTPRPSLFEKGSSGRRRILYVSSRPDLEKDVSYRAISRKIWGLLETDDQREVRQIIRFVRPGTWDNFKAKLKDYGKDYFDIVHFDMHGTIKKRAGKEM
jgi:hypothetical protein